MKRVYRLLSLLLCMTFVLGFSSCGKVSTKKNNITIYGVSNKNTGLVTAEYQNKSSSGNKLIEELLGKLTTTDKKKKMDSAIPAEVTVNGYDLTDGILKIDFNNKYYEQSVKRELLCRSAVVLTLSQIKEVEYVAFTVNGKPCKRQDGGYLNAMEASDFVMNLGKTNAAIKSDFTLYFANEKGTALKEYYLKSVDYGNKSKERFIVEKLIKGPEKKGYSAVLSNKVKVVSVVTANGICYVDFDGSFLTEQSSASAQVVVYSIVDSLLELDGVHKVQISVNGDTTEKYDNKISLSQPFIRNLDIIEK